MYRGLVGSAVVFAVLPGFLENCSRQYPALGQWLEMARSFEQAPAWRWPVLPIEAVTTLCEREVFLAQAVERLGQLVAHCMGDVNGLEDRLRIEGDKILFDHVGSGYRRLLMKRLATVALDRLEGES